MRLQARSPFTLVFHFGPSFLLGVSSLLGKLSANHGTEAVCVVCGTTVKEESALVTLKNTSGIS